MRGNSRGSRKRSLAASFVVYGQHLQFFKYMAVFCIPRISRDPETGCIYDSCGSNQYQSCRQAYYLKKQNEITESAQQVISNSFNEKIGNLEKLVEDQNKQITELVESSRENAQTVGELKISLQNSYILSTVLGLLLAGLVTFLIIKKFRK